jgi:hypothetical protein
MAGSPPKGADWARKEIECAALLGVCGIEVEKEWRRLCGLVGGDRSVRSGSKGVAVLVIGTGWEVERLCGDCS